jgi:hypothetical protein
MGGFIVLPRTLSVWLKSRWCCENHCCINISIESGFALVEIVNCTVILIKLHNNYKYLIHCIYSHESGSVMIEQKNINRRKNAVLYFLNYDQSIMILVFYIIIVFTLNL